ncbi:MAG: hypothetical protein HYZ57_01045 [Acidobacteria bacterium]|nr:hypothetical protein [Acidobacteriota bacterium]
MRQLTLGVCAAVMLSCSSGQRPREDFTKLANEFVYTVLANSSIAKSWPPRIAPITI